MVVPEELDGNDALGGPCRRSAPFTAFSAEFAGLLGSPPGSGALALAAPPGPEFAGAPGETLPADCEFPAWPGSGSGLSGLRLSLFSPLCCPSIVVDGLAGGRRCAPYSCAADGAGGAFGSLFGS